MMCFFVVLVVNSAIYSSKILAYSLQVCSSAINSAKKILLNLCKGVARSKVFLIVLLTIAPFIPMCRDEIFMISTEEKE